MNNNCFNLSDKSLQEDYEDLVFRKIMSIHLEEESKQILEEMKNNKSDEKPDTNKIFKLIKKNERREQRNILAKYFKKVFLLAASFCFVAIISLSSVVVAFADVREAVTDIIYHLVFEENERYTVVSVGETTGFVNPEIYDWEGAYAPTYMPEGFEYAGRDDTINYHSIDYVNKDLCIYITQFSNGIVKVDTEDSINIEQFTINGSDAITYQKGDLTSVSWRSGETVIWIQSDISLDEIIKIAENMKILK